CGPLGCPASEATLVITASCTGGSSCLVGKISGDFFGTGVQETFNAGDLGVTFSADFGPSAVSTLPHAIFTVKFPLAITQGNDPADFFPNEGAMNVSQFAIWSVDGDGYTAPVLGSNASVGTPPYAAAPCPGGKKCSAPPPPATYGFCASFSNN